ncbi:hypothetical protein [Pyrococcus horikoshii]|uniref:Uncharacterized protein n=1 Tax=Pyrococcus horikoshii TaxID=53953 RepID=A0A832WL39_PYRHR|nr:hypothetical protein [Pyrococcus horikoshii]HII61789.1 hypothetical protein [Pyrococcus horikoshii]
MVVYYYCFTRLPDEPFWTYTGDWTTDINEAIKWLKAANENLLVKIVVDTRFHKFPPG